MNNKNNSVTQDNPTPLRQPRQVGRALLARQPVLGSLMLLVVMALSLLIISCFKGDFFASWVTFVVVVGVPVEIVLSMLWRSQYPGWVAALPQPTKGLVMLVLTLAMACAVSAVIFYTQAQQVGPPTPFTLMYVIFCVLLTFWFVIVWRCWPLSSFTENPAILGIGTLLVAYGLGYLLFCVLFDFSVMAQAPFYLASLDPHGLFAAFEILAFAVTSVSVVFAGVLLDFWPLNTATLARKPRLLAVAITVQTMAVTALFYWVGTRVLGIEPVKFMVHGAIALLFGALVPLLMFEGQLFEHRTQPVRGLLQLGIACLAGAVLPRLYWVLGPLLSGPMSEGAPAYTHELWLASTLLAMTFPLLVVSSQYFDFWPLRKA